MAALSGRGPSADSWWSGPRSTAPVVGGTRHAPQSLPGSRAHCLRPWRAGPPALATVDACGCGGQPPESRVAAAAKPWPGREPPPRLSSRPGPEPPPRLSSQPGPEPPPRPDVAQRFCGNGEGSPMCLPSQAGPHCHPRAALLRSTHTACTETKVRPRARLQPAELGQPRRTVFTGPHVASPFFLNEIPTRSLTSNTRFLATPEGIRVAVSAPGGSFDELLCAGLGV